MAALLAGLLVDQLLGQEHDAVVAVVVGDASGPDDPLGHDGLDQVEVGGQLARRGTAGRSARMPARYSAERGHLLLLEP